MHRGRAATQFSRASALSAAAAQLAEHGVEHGDGCKPPTVQLEAAWCPGNTRAPGTTRASRQHASVHSTRPSSRPGTERAPRQALSARQGNTRAPQATRKLAGNTLGRAIAPGADSRAGNELATLGRSEPRSSRDQCSCVSPACALARTASTASRSIQSITTLPSQEPSARAPSSTAPAACLPLAGCVVRAALASPGRGPSLPASSCWQGRSISRGKSARPCPAAASPAQTRALPLAACCLLCANRRRKIPRVGEKWCFPTPLLSDCFRARRRHLCQRPEGGTPPRPHGQGRAEQSSRAAEQQSSRAAEQQSSRAAEQQSSRAAEQQEQQRSSSSSAAAQHERSTAGSGRSSSAAAAQQQRSSEQGEHQATTTGSGRVGSARFEARAARAASGGWPAGWASARASE